MPNYKVSIIGDDPDAEAPEIPTSLRIHRPVYNQPHFDEKYEQIETPPKTVKEYAQGCCEMCLCDTPCLKRTVLNFFPFIRIMRRYNIRVDLLADIMAGLTVGVMQIPQGMAYGMLATVPAVFGLYTSFFPVLVYFFFGTSMHISIGPFAISALMMAGPVESICDITDGFMPLEPPIDHDRLIPTTEALITTSAPVNELACRAEVASTLVFCVALIMLGLGLFRMGWLSVYLSEPLTRGFTTACAVQVLNSQIKYLFGLEIERYSGVWHSIYLYRDFFSMIGQTNIAEFLIGFGFMIFLYLSKELIGPRFRKKFKIPFPAELFVVILGTLMSHYLRFPDKYNVSVVGEIPTGIPAPGVPDMSLIPKVLPSAVAITIVGYTNTITLARLFGKKHNYEIGPNQELVAGGFCNLIGAFFSCIHTGVSLSRSLVFESAGAVTQLTGVFSCGVVLLVLLFIGPLFQDLPNSVLAAILIVASKGMFLQVKDVPKLWRVDKVDLAIWLITCVGTILLDTELGLVLGVTFSLLSVVYRAQKAHTSLLGQFPKTNIYKNVKLYEEARELSGIKIFRFEAPLHYANQEHFVERLFERTGVNPRRLRNQRHKYQKKQKDLDKDLRKRGRSQSAISMTPSGEFWPGDAVTKNEVRVEMPQCIIHTIIIDCSMIGYIDSMGVSVLSQVIREYETVDILVLLAGCKCRVRRTLRHAKFFRQKDPHCLYLTIHDAVQAATAGTVAEPIHERVRKISTASSVTIESNIFNEESSHL